MKIVSVLALVLGVLASTPVLAGKEAEVAAARLLDSMNMEAVMKSAVEVSIEAQLTQNPDLAPYRDVFTKFLGMHMSYEALKPEFVALYAAEFSAAELDEATAFYATPTGKKFLARIPVLFSKGAEIGQAAVAKNLPELQEAIRAESQRMKKSDQAGDGG